MCATSSFEIEASRPPRQCRSPVWEDLHIEKHRVVTIGVYGWTIARFLDALREADVALLLDGQVLYNKRFGLQARFLGDAAAGLSGNGFKRRKQHRNQ